MPFTLISGTFHVVGRTAKGKEFGFEPDGDSMQFAPAADQRGLLDELERLDQPVRLSPGTQSTQLRFEGIDALELHYRPTVKHAPESHQPRPLADQSRDWLTGELGLNPLEYEPPDDLAVVPPVAHDAVPGYIMSRALDVHGRPVSFAFAGDPPMEPGTDMMLDNTLLEESLNYRSLAAGESYPLFYDTLFADLRAHLAAAAEGARQDGLGLWPQDRSHTGVPAASVDDLERDGVTFPKLFRRLCEFLAQPEHDLDAFGSWLEALKEPILDTRTTNFTHFDNVVTVGDGGVALTRLPEELVFVSAKTTSASVAPWVAH